MPARPPHPPRANRGATLAPRRLRPGGAMARFDRLPPDLRAWLCAAALPWSARFAARIWTRALAETGRPEAALARLTQAEARALAREAAVVWGPGHPAGQGGAQPPAGARNCLASFSRWP